MAAVLTDRRQLAAQLGNGSSLDLALLQWRYMSKEDEELMPIAAQHLIREEWELITTAFKRNDNPLCSFASVCWRSSGSTSVLSDCVLPDADPGAVWHQRF